jgi:class 3 adenylate cyclase
MQPGVVALRSAVTAAWEADLRAVRQDTYDTSVGKEALAFIQRFYSLVSQLRAPIQRAWGPGGLVPALAAQKALMSEPWTDKIPISVRMAVLTGEADAQDRDYRAPAVNRCAKLRRRAVGNQILVSETTYSIVADILRDDIRLVSVGRRRLEGHDRDEVVYVVQHPEVALEGTVAEDPT